MTGICYFTEKPTEYLAEMQVDAVVRYTEDDAVTLKMEGIFSPEKADKLIEKAISDKCDNLVFITENKNVNILNRLIPQEYGKYFENITVLEENYDRLTENDAVAGAAPQGKNVAPAQVTNTQVNQTGTENTATTSQILLIKMLKLGSVMLIMLDLLQLIFFIFIKIIHQMQFVKQLGLQTFL